ncbi:VWA domain-containing protein [Paenibacillus sp. GCM10027627]|uniref:VWA domain-containing protein n=1 Tax=unclassified Paenibacillus TaxID=185978 RepID=UPI0036455404
MGVQADSPWLLLLLVPWLFYIGWMVKGTPRLKGKRKAAVIATRALITFLLIIIAAGLAPYRTVEERNLVFVADRSASMKSRDEIGKWIADAWKSKSTEDQGAIVSTGLHAAADRPLTSESLLNQERYEFKTGLNDRYTDLSKGLQLAAAMLAGRDGRIVLLSDGAQNAGDVMRQAKLLKDAGIAVDVVDMSSELEKDAAIDELIVPSVLKQGETFSFELRIQSTFAGDAELTLFEDNREISTSSIRLEKGENRFALQSVALDSGFHRFRAELFLPGDGEPANNAAHAFSRVSGPPSVLVVEGTPGTSGNIESALASSLIRHLTISPEQLSLELAEYAAYDSIILNNVPATRIAEKPMEWLSKAVGDYGVGLMMLGGDESFGLGGYFQTPVEDALPVYMDLKGKKQIPSLGLVLVIDRSGSMSDGKLELAKEAAIRTVELLRDADTVGVVAFDSAPQWVVEPTKLSERESIIRQIQSIQPSGGTEIYTALDAGYRGLLDFEAQRKHMILLTDGQSSTSMNYATITDAMVENNMTLSTVAVGDGSDTALLESLAKNGNGRYYFTKDQSTLPAIFSRETVLMSRTYIVDGTITPSIGAAGDWNSLWENGLPQLQAYIATTPKEMAETALWSPDGDPLLARWTYGSGRSVAWTSDFTGKWAPGWTGWNEFPAIFTEWVKWTFPQFDSSPYRISTSMNGPDGKLIVESTSDDGGAAQGLEAVIQNADGETVRKQLLPVAPGRYEAELGPMNPGAYLTGIETSKNGQSGGEFTAGYVIPYSPEYRIGDGSGAETLKRVAALTGGRELSAVSPAEGYHFEPSKWKEPYDWTREWLIAILLLWLLDIALRRVSLPWQSMMARLGKAMSSRHRHERNVGAATASSMTTLSKLKKRTEEKSRFYSNNKEKQERKETLASPASVQREPLLSSKQLPITDSKKTAHDWPITPAETKPNDEGPKPDDDHSTVNRLLAAKNKIRR